MEEGSGTKCKMTLKNILETGISVSKTDRHNNIFKSRVIIFAAFTVKHAFLSIKKVYVISVVNETEEIGSYIWYIAQST